MKLSCEVIKDLLPLYEDEVCSEESRGLVEEHLTECAECRALQEKFKIPEIALLPEEEIFLAEEEKRIQRIFRRIKRRWRLSLAAVLLLIPLICVGVIGYHEYRGEGLCFTNIDEVMVCSRFFKLLEEGKYEEASVMIDFASGYQSITRAFQEGYLEEEWYAWYDKYYGYTPDMSEEEYVQKWRSAFVKFMKENHVLFQRARYSDAYRIGTEWVIEYAVTENVMNMDGSNRFFKISMAVRDGKLQITSANIGFNIEDSDIPSFLDIFFRKFDENGGGIECFLQ